MSVELNINIIPGKATDKDMLYRKCFVFVLDIIQYTELLEKKGKYSVAIQLLKTGTALGVYMNELKNIDNQSVLNKNIKKMNKEAQEIRYRLLLCKYSQTYPNPVSLIADIEELSELISKL
jgi:four helix bundle protein